MNLVLWTKLLYSPASIIYGIRNSHLYAEFFPGIID